MPLVGHPLETMKARVQMGLPSWPGLRGLYVGLAAPILGNVPFWACYFASYRAAQRHVAPYFGDDTAAAQLAVGAVAGAASAVALTPIDAVKVTAQVDQVSTADFMRPHGKQRSASVPRSGAPPAPRKPHRSPCSERNFSALLRPRGSILHPTISTGMEVSIPTPWPSQKFGLIKKKLILPSHLMQMKELTPG